jgi:hypothetical protein
MKPIGLTMKNGRNKYRLTYRGELMLVHECTECTALSINRIAADDDPSTILEIFQASMESPIHARCLENGIQMLKAQDEDSVYKQLYGGIEVPATVWSA